MNDGDGKEATHGLMRWMVVIGSMFLSWVLTVAQKNDEGFVKNYGQAQGLKDLCHKDSSLLPSSTYALVKVAIGCKT